MVVMAVVAAAVIGSMALSASAQPSYASQLTFSPDNPTYDPYGTGTQLLGAVTVTGGGWLDFTGRSVVQTPDRAGLNPGTADFTFGARIALTRGVGDWNVMQKAYFNDQQWKLSTFSAPGGAKLGCRFSGSLGTLHVITSSAVVPTDGTWHDVACVRSGTTVQVMVDGAVVAQGTGPTGSIVSQKPYLVGSKGMTASDPDQFLGLLDDAYVVRDDNPGQTGDRAPSASLTVTSCDKQLVCTFDASASSDPDSDPLTYAWDFGDGSDTTGVTGAVVTHQFPADGSYPVTVTVQDPAGSTGMASRTIKVLSVDPQVAFRESSGALTNSKAITAVVPAAVQAGDALVLVVVANRSDVNLTAPSGWRSLGRQVDETMQSQVWTRDAVPSNAGASVRVTTPSTTKMTATVLGYSSTGATSPVVTAVSQPEAGTTAAHVTPVATTVPGSWTVSVWADRSNTTASWTAPPGVTVRQFLSGTNTSHVTSLVADSGGPVGTTSAGALTATASSASGTATMWTIVVSPG
jgi:hypothetical protein